MRAGRRRSGLVGWALLTVVLALVAAACAGTIDPGGSAPQNAMEPAGPVAQQQKDLWNLVFPIAAGVFIFVQGGLIFLVWKYRSRPDDPVPPKQLHGNTRLEVVWTIIPALVLVTIAVPTVRTIFDIAAAPEDPLEVRVIAKQYWFEFQYLGDEGQGVVTATELHVPTGREVLLHMESLSAIVPDTEGEVGPKVGPVADGVVHSFWVPRLAGKVDMVPGYVRPLKFQADEPGIYPGQCAEFCGLSHANMRFTVVAHEPADYETWLEGQAQPAAEPQDASAMRGAEIWGAQTCQACHTLEGNPANVDTRIAPNLTHLASRETFAGGMFEVNAENLKRWIRNAPAEKPGAQMPPFAETDLSDEELDDLVNYLLTLE